jgi:hypothetical protein
LKGKLIWKSLKTNRRGVARLRLGDFLKGGNHRAEIVQSAARGKMTFDDAVETEDRQALIEEFVALVPEATIATLRAKLNVSRNAPTSPPLAKTA